MYAYICDVNYTNVCKHPAFLYVMWIIQMCMNTPYLLYSVYEVYISVYLYICTANCVHVYKCPAPPGAQCAILPIYYHTLNFFTLVYYRYYTTLLLRTNYFTVTGRYCWYLWHLRCGHFLRCSWGSVLSCMCVCGCVCVCVWVCGCVCGCVCVSLAHTHTHTHAHWLTHTLSHTHTHSLSHTHTHPHRHSQKLARY